jgi:hypothetical protein
MNQTTGRALDHFSATIYYLDDLDCKGSEYTHTGVGSVAEHTTYVNAARSDFLHYREMADNIEIVNQTIGFLRLAAIELRRLAGLELDIGDALRYTANQCDREADELAENFDRK